MYGQTRDKGQNWTRLPFEVPLCLWQWWVWIQIGVPVAAREISGLRRFAGND